MTMTKVLILRATGTRLVSVGTITGSRTDGFRFDYLEGYVASQNAFPLSLSLPLDGGPFEERAFRPYFEGLLAEGEPRRRLCAEAGIAEDDYLSLLVYCGRDCIGDVMVWDASSGDVPPERLPEASFVRIPEDEMRTIFRDSSGIADSNNASRLSLAGTQNKVGLAHASSGPWERTWLRPRSLTPSTHILKTSDLRDLPELEFLCMRAAKECGIECAETHLVQFGRPVVVSGRFDREVRELPDGTIVGVDRVHQEDFAQALSVTPASKYMQLPGGTIGAMARVLRTRSSSPLKDLAMLTRVLIFNYLIGNCDAHLKNFSLYHPHGDGTSRLSPAYDLVGTTYFERFSREMAMTIGEHRDIDAVTPGDFGLLADEIHLGVRFVRRVADSLVSNITTSLMSTAESPEALESTPYIAEDLVDDMQPRLKVLKRFVNA